MREHTPPSTYILRNIVDVAVPENVSWWPQTLGWKILAALLVLLCLLGLYRWCRHWWHNRYRQEAIKALESVDLAVPQHAASELMTVMKAVLTYLDPRHGSLFGEQLLAELDRLYPHSHFHFSGEIGRCWQASLLTSQQQINRAELDALFAHSKEWLANHRVGDQRD